MTPGAPLKPTVTLNGREAVPANESLKLVALKNQTIHLLMELNIYGFCNIKKNLSYDEMIQELIKSYLETKHLETKKKHQ